MDTNVLVYLFDGDAPDKQARAQELLREERDRLVASVQVLGEFYVTVTRKLSVPLRRLSGRRAGPAGNQCKICTSSIRVRTQSLARRRPL